MQLIFTVLAIAMISAAWLTYIAIGLDIMLNRQESRRRQRDHYSPMDIGNP